MDKQNYDLAEEDYINGMKYKEIAEKYNVSINTVKSWKTRYKWCKDKKSMHTKNKKVCTQNKNGASIKKNKENSKEPIADEVKEVMENEDLTDKQRLFCVIYAKCMNATKAYQKVYRCTYETAMVNGSNLLRNTKVKEQIDSLTAIQFNKEALKRSVIQKYIDIAFADIGDYVKFGKKYRPAWTKDKEGRDVPVIDPNTGEQKIKEYNYLDLKESSLVDTTLINEVAEGKDGIKFKLADKMKALDFLTKHCNLLSDEEKIKLDIANKQLQNVKLQAETEKIKGKDKDEQINIVIKRKERD
ncbi:phage portal protein [Clostridium botulinum]|uniref:Phage terminase, small subunit, PBSX family n=1 Tax=Clostridium botulinum (strain Eklund 17B / Type B) TaxID=935198 RepID=B2TNX6_CLOBB|nr:phage terminase, small subunit, PBSX family [Clostridium botulinum B str. Eklund 17B (NRP)]MBY6976245.1 terminase small subunit [Clostridium botulinum]MBY7000670.1 terminase small subunit [Clostridium botulinum]MCR1273434.1 terminase small subunit [Clostridium botulinum]NFD71307.1 phage portal protein [Clostridium botulinum]